MTNIAYRDRTLFAPPQIYMANSHLPKWQRINLALKELRNIGNIEIYLYSGKGLSSKQGKFRLIKTKKF
jgi:hypothetical protein